MDRVHDQWSSCVATVHRMDGSTFDLGGESGVKNSDITSGTVSKDVHSPCGGFQLTVQPNKQYMKLLQPNQWITIKMDNGDGRGLRPVMFGLIDRVGRARAVFGKGTEKQTIVVSGRDWGKALVQTPLLFDPVLGNMAALAGAIQGYVTWNKNKPNEFNTISPANAMAFYLRYFLQNRHQFLLPRNITLVDALTFDASKASNLAGHLFLLSSLNVNGSLWQLLEGCSMPLLNEFYTSWDAQGAPVLVLRQYPFSRGDFQDLESVDLPATAVCRENVGLDDHDVYNWFRVHVDWEGRVDTGITTGMRLGYVDLNSIAQHGLRRFEHTTNALFPANQQGDGFSGSLAQALGGMDTGKREWVWDNGVIRFIENATQKLAEWHAINQKLLNGQITAKLLPDAMVGRRVDYKNKYSGDEISYYLEGLTHSFVYDERSWSSTTMNVTRGVDASGGFAALKPFEQLGLTALRDTNFWADLGSLQS